MYFLVCDDSVKPTHYALDIFNLNRQQFTYDGVVSIDLDVKETTKSISVNYKELKISEAEVLLPGSDNIKSSDISYNEKGQVVTFTFPQEVQAGAKNAVLRVAFSGVMNNEMAGFYRSAYKNKEGQDDFMYSTQFESCDARRTFPCFDEPNLKASFDFSIVVPESYTALSNQPEISSESVGNGEKKVTFSTSPKMSTYLYAWACGDFEYIETHTEKLYNGKPLPVRVYTTKGLVDQGRFALENAAKIVDYFSTIFEIDYPLPKVDLLAVHEFSHGAMENWGLITYRTTAVLYDEATSDSRYKNRVAYVVAHELAHQWFGNLVTMDWWSELWLNEGFATWVGWLAVDKFYPEWDVWGQFVTESLQTAFQLDSLRGSHPIEVPVKNALDIDQIFDHISYLKGSGTIRMLSKHLGVKTFLKGVALYLKKHAYGNATTEDLWAALGEASGLDVSAFMRNWIQKIGFPVITVTEKPGELHVKQARFLSTGDVKSEEDTTTWWVPLMLTEKSIAAANAVEVSALTTKEATLKNIDTTHYKLNDGQNGFYRVNYPAERLAKLGEIRKSLSVSDRVGVIADAAAMALSGLGSTTGLLSFLAELKDEESYLVWAEVIEQLGKLRSVFSEASPEIKENLKKFTLQLVSPAVTKIGWEFAKDEDFLTSRLRALLISAAGAAGHEGIVKEAQRRFDLYITGKDKSAIHPNLRLAVFRIVIAEGGAEEYNAIVNEYLSTTSVDGREITLSALGRVRKPELIEEYLKFMLSDNVKTQDKHTPAISLSANTDARRALWEFVKANWETIYKQLSGNMVVLDRFLKNSLNKFASQEVLDDIQAFFKNKDNAGYERGLDIVSDTVRGNISWVQRDTDAVAGWLKQHVA